MIGDAPRSETPRAAADALFKKLQEDFERYQADIITSKLLIQGLTEELKVFQKASSLGVQAGATIQEKTLKLALQEGKIKT